MLRARVVAAAVAALSLTAGATAMAADLPASTPPSADPVAAAPAVTVPPSPPTLPSAAPGPSTATARPVALVTTASRPPLSFTTGPKGKGKPIIYLTFDDGPGPYTKQVLDLLGTYKARATFFVIGNQVKGRQALLKREVRSGFPVQNHTWSHPDLKRLSASRQVQQIRFAQNAIQRATGVPPKCLRPPYGSENGTVRASAWRYHLRTALWSVDTVDWSRPGAGVIAKRALRGARNGAIVLMHDGGGNRSQSVAALRTVLRTLNHQGYRFGVLCG